MPKMTTSRIFLMGECDGPRTRGGGARAKDLARGGGARAEDLDRGGGAPAEDLEFICNHLAIIMERPQCGV